MHKIFFVISSIVIADQITKFWIHKNLAFMTYLDIFPFFKIVHFQNKGAAFSFLHDAAGWQRYFLITVSMIAIVVIPFFIKKNKKEPLALWSFTFILAGAIGNLIDRIYYGYVIDFIYLHVNDFYWPAFNIADSFITIGAFLLIFDMVKKSREK
jgi:signal peptidase II